MRLFTLSKILPRLPAHNNIVSARGSVLMVIIVAITIAGGLGTAMYSMTSTSTFTQLGSMDATRAYLLAESGGQYAIKQIVDLEQNSSVNDTARDSLVAALKANTMTLSDAGQFSFPSVSYSTDTSFRTYIIKAVGAVGGASNAISGVLTYEVSLPKDPNGIDITPDEDPDDDEALNPDNWNVVGDAELDTDDKELELGDDGEDTQVSFNWQDDDSTMPDLGEIWSDSGSLLSYEVQIKIELDQDEDILAGISFRLNTFGDSNITNDAFYGLSYLWCKDGDEHSFCTSGTYGKSYIVLWKQDSSGTQTVISKKLASSVDPDLVDSSGELEDWSALIVRVQEQVNPNTSIRENLIYAYIAAENDYSKGTVHWDYSYFTAVSWDSCTTDCSSGSDCSCVADTTYTSANFNTTPQDEIGLHTFGGEDSEIWDINVRFNYNNMKVTSY